MFRVSPRVEIIFGKFKMDTEIEYTAAQYGTDGNDLKVISGSTNKINNIHFLFTTTFSFLKNPNQFLL